jgi:hypothetical protein
MSNWSAWPSPRSRRWNRYELEIKFLFENSYGPRLLWSTFPVL